MATPPEAGLTDYERRRQENIRRNDAILASLRRKAADLSAAIQSSAKRVKKQPRASPVVPATSAVLRRSLRTQGLPPSGSADTTSSPPPTPASPPKTRSTRISSSLVAAICTATSTPPPEVKVRADGFDPGRELVLKPENVRRVVPDRILSVLLLPLVDRTVVAAGNKLGNIGFWDVDGVVEGDGSDDGADGVFEYLPHRGPVGAIVAHPAAPRKIYSCSYEGEICIMDLEKENFDMIHLCDYSILSLCQAPNSASSLYFGEGNELKLFDERMGKVSATWNLHNNRINSIDFHPENTYMLATSSTDGTACIWDLRAMKKDEAGSLKVMEHKRSVQSAYFSPSGIMVATTCLDDTVRIFSTDNFDKSHTFKHYNQTGRWLSTFKAIWGWNDTELFIGNMKRAIDVISVDLNNSSLSASNSSCLESEYMTAIPCRFSAHPYKVGHLACASSGGKVFLWMMA